jgi:putative membrane protein
MSPDDAPPPADARSDREAAVRDHLANERTLLAWQRTALAMIGIGFLVARFAFDPAAGELAGALLGTVLMLGGAGVAVVGAYRFVRTEREIDSGTYRPAVLAHLVLSATVAVAAVALAAFALLMPA